MNILLIIYAILMLAGGIYGYAAKNSVPSLISSSVAFVLICLGLWLTQNNRSLGYGIIAVVALALAGFFGMRVAGGHYMPGIPALVASLVALACVVFGHFMRK